MKRSLRATLAAVLALAMAFTVVLPAFSAAPRAWNAEKKGFVLTDGPEIVRLTEDSNEYGTWVHAFYRNTRELREIGDAFHATVGNEDKIYGDLLGYTTDEIDGDFEVAVQVAYSFDGVNWVNDWEAGDDWVLITSFDRNGDGFNEYRHMPLQNENEKDYYGEIKVFDGRDDCFSAYWCDPISGMTIQQAITLRNNAMLQGRGEYLGSYQKDADDSGYGMAVDFNANTLYVKARYRVYNYTSIREEGKEVVTSKEIYYSNWGNTKTFNNNTASPESQNCVPDVGVLKSNVAPELKALSSWREKVTEDGVQITQTTYRLAIDYPAALDEALAKFRAYDWSRDRYIREEITGEWWDPQAVIEFRVNDGDWFFFEQHDISSPYFFFCDNTWYMRDKLEAVGFQPGDTVYLRARIYGENSFYTAKEDDGPDCEKVFESDPVMIRSGISNVVELNLSGIYNITYELNGGSFAWGTTQISQFDEDTNVTVDLTSADYTPSWRNHAFKGWYEDAALTKPITSFNTELKMSRTYYAKWEELPFYTLSYDMGVITGNVWNPNPARIYVDDGVAGDGVIGLNEAEYDGATFLGWYDKPTGGNRITTLSYAAMTGNITLYAYWDLPTYTITYSGAGADYTNDTRNPATFQIDPGAGVNVKLYAPAKRGYIFDGWFFNKDLTHEALSYSESDGAWIMNKAENVTVYAKFILGRWKINYELGIEGVWNGANPETHTYGTAVELQDPSRTGYTFGGWYEDKALTKPITVIPDDAEGEVTVYAKWTAIVYTIKYDLRDPNVEMFFQNTNPTTRTVDDEVILKPLVSTSPLYMFLGWYDNVNYDGKPVEKISAGTDKNVTLYAKLLKHVWGDVDFDGTVTAGDARLVLRHAVGLENLPDEARAWGDLADHNAEHALTAADARLVLRMAVLLDTTESLKLPEYPVN
ncbi:MAG: InlB B-repeat-containing protein [Clostridia bacterium]|nr:InlB B-repeat-containing protein [Clostridia bacterium]